MKLRAFYWTGLLSYFYMIFGQICFAEYLPLLGSDWSEKTENQELLPYSDCALGTYDHGNHSDIFMDKSWRSLYDPKFNSKGDWIAPVVHPRRYGSQGGFILGWSTIQASDYFDQIYLACISKKLKLAFVIPVDMSNVTNVFEFGSGNYPLPIRFNSSKLSGNTISDLFGTWTGPISGHAIGGTDHIDAQYFHGTNHNSLIEAKLKLPLAEDEMAQMESRSDSRYSLYKAGSFLRLIGGTSTFQLRELKEESYDGITKTIFAYNPFVLISTTKGFQSYDDTDLQISSSGQLIWDGGNGKTGVLGQHDLFGRKVNAYVVGANGTVYPIKEFNSEIPAPSGDVFFGKLGISPLALALNDENVNYHTVPMNREEIGKGRVVTFRKKSDEKLNFSPLFTRYRFVHDSTLE